MFITEFRLPSLTVVMPENSFTGRPLKNHLNTIGKSPDVTRHWTLAESAKLDGRSPNANCAILGGTIIIYSCSLNNIQEEIHFMWNNELYSIKTKNHFSTLLPFIRLNCDWIRNNSACIQLLWGLEKRGNVLNSPSTSADQRLGSHELTMDCGHKGVNVIIYFGGTKIKWQKQKSISNSKIIYLVCYRQTQYRWQLKSHYSDQLRRCLKLRMYIFRHASHWPNQWLKHTFVFPVSPSKCQTFRKSVVRCTATWNSTVNRQS